MTYVFPATYRTHSNMVGSQTLVFEIEDANRDLIGDIAKMPRGTPLLIVAYEIEEGKDPVRSLVSNPKEVINKFLKQIHARMGEYAEETGVPSEEIKRLLKVKLKARDIVKVSLKDLSESELAKAVYILSTELHPSRFNYNEYKK